MTHFALIVVLTSCKSPLDMTNSPPSAGPWTDMSPHPTSGSVRVVFETYRERLVRGESAVSGALSVDSSRPAVLAFPCYGSLGRSRTHSNRISLGHDAVRLTTHQVGQISPTEYIQAGNVCLVRLPTSRREFSLEVSVSGPFLDVCVGSTARVHRTDGGTETLDALERRASIAPLAGARGTEAPYLELAGMRCASLPMGQSSPPTNGR